jgi:hypothetical protein
VPTALANDLVQAAHGGIRVDGVVDEIGQDRRVDSSRTCSISINPAGGGDVELVVERRHPPPRQTGSLSKHACQEAVRNFFRDRRIDPPLHDIDMIGVYFRTE